MTQIQGQGGAQRRQHQRRALHLSDPHGGRHPALPRGAGPGRRRPAAAPRAHARPRAAVQRAVRRHVHGADRSPRRDGEDLRPAVRRQADEQDLAQFRRRDLDARRPCRLGQAHQGRGHRRRPRDPLRPGVQARGRQPADHSLSALCRDDLDALTEHFAGKGYGDLKAEVADVVTSVLGPFRQRTLELLDDPAELDRILADGALQASEVAERTLVDVYDKVGLCGQAGMNDPVHPRTIGVAIPIPDPGARSCRRTARSSATRSPRRSPRVACTQPLVDADELPR